jgi:hypothetical protein
VRRACSSTSVARFAARRSDRSRSWSPAKDWKPNLDAEAVKMRSMFFMSALVIPGEEASMPTSTTAGSPTLISRIAMSTAASAATTRPNTAP